MFLKTTYFHNKFSKNLSNIFYKLENYFYSKEPKTVFKDMSKNNFQQFPNMSQKCFFPYFHLRKKVGKVWESAFLINVYFFSLNFSMETKQKKNFIIFPYLFLSFPKIAQEPNMGYLYAFFFLSLKLPKNQTWATYMSNETSFWACVFFRFLRCYYLDARIWY